MRKYSTVCRNNQNSEQGKSMTNCILSIFSPYGSFHHASPYPVSAPLPPPPTIPSPSASPRTHESKSNRDYHGRRISPNSEKSANSESSEKPIAVVSVNASKGFRIRCLINMCSFCRAHHHQAVSGNRQHIQHPKVIRRAAIVHHANVTVIGKSHGRKIDSLISFQHFDEKRHSKRFHSCSFLQTKPKQNANAITFIHNPKTLIVTVAM